MLLQLAFMTLRTFRILRIIDQYSPLVFMLKRVIRDLSFFLLAFFINIVIFRNVLTILQNDESKHYKYLGTTIGNYIDTLRCSIGNFEVIKRVRQDVEHSIMFWGFWTAIVVLQVIILLNFIIADTTASYNKIRKILNEIVQQDKCSMLSEAEQMLPKLF